MDALRLGRRVWGTAVTVLVPAMLVAAVLVAAGPGADPAAAVAGHRDGVLPAGVMSVVAGGVGGPAEGTQVILGGACGVSYVRGVVYVADDSAVRRVYPRSGWLNTPAGIGPGLQFTPPLGDGGPAASASLTNACGATADRSGNVIIADTGDNRVRVVARLTGRLFGRAVTAGDIYTVAGTGRAGFSGDGHRASQAELNSPGDVTVDSAGNLLIADSGNDRIRVVAARTGTFYQQAMTAGDIYTIAGDGTAGFAGDGGAAAAAELNSPHAAAVDGAGNLLIADSGNNRIRVVAARTGTFYRQVMRAGDIYTVAGDGGAGFAGDGSLASSAELNGPQGVAVDAAGNLVIADTGNDRVRVVAAHSGTFYGKPVSAGDIYTVAGTAGPYFSGNGGRATAAEFLPNGMYLSVNGIVADHAGNVVFDASGAIRVLVAAARTGRFYGRAMTAGHVYSIAGDGGYGFAGDGGPATKANFEYPSGLAIDSFGNVLISDSQNNRIRVIAEQTGTFYGQSMTAGDIYTIAGNGGCGDSGDGGPATSAELCITNNITVDAAGNVLIAQGIAPAIRVVAAATGIFYGQSMTAGDIYTIAGNGSTGYSGDGGPATSASFDFPEGVGVDAFGNVLIGDTENNRIRVVAEHTGTFYGVAMNEGDIYTVAGTGNCGFNGDGIPATAAGVCAPGGVPVDSAGNLIFADGGNRRIRVVPDTSGTYYGQSMTAGDIYTIAGNGIQGCAGNGGPATAAEIGNSQGVWDNSADDLIISDPGCREIRHVVS